VSETATETTKASAKKKASKERKPPVRRPITVMVPVDIEDMEAKDREIPEPAPLAEGEDESKRPEVEAVEMTAVYHMYIVPGGMGQKKAIRTILAKHNVDLRNIARVRMFAGEKPFRVETQYNIRF